MSDKDNFIAMLDRAQIPYKETVTDRDAPEGSTSVLTGDWNGDFGKSPAQPLPGGYSGFLSEHVFGSDGNLLAIWSWE